MTEIEDILIDIQDYLVPNLDSYEQAVYHYLFRHTYLEGKKQTLYRTRTAEIGLGIGDNTKKASTKTRSRKLRSLEEKGYVKIIERSNKGILVEILLPSEIPGIKSENIVEEEIDIEGLDFYKDKRLLKPLLERENYHCFYTGKVITAENCFLDHVVPQSSGGGNSYKNIVATCFDANSMKNDLPVDDFIRNLYKKDILSLSEFDALKQKIAGLKAGKIVPDIMSIKNAINS